MTSIFITLFFLFSVSVGSVYAHPGHTENVSFFGQNQETDYDKQYDDLRSQEDKKKELEAKIYEVQQQERTLANQISYLESQISLTSIEQNVTKSEIQDTQSQLDVVNVDIDDLTNRLGNLDESMGSLNSVLSARVRAAYEVESVRHGFLLDQANYQRMVLQTIYLNTLQKEDNRLMAKMASIRSVYETQKAELENLKHEKEALRAQLEQQNAQLEQQKQNLSDQQGAKSWLLGVTQSEEQQYQVLLAQVEEEIRAIKSALISLGTKIGEVKQGDVIAHLGNTGCSTGAHLHFGYYVDGVALDPTPLLSNGTFIHPVKDPVITQGFNDPNTRAWYQANFGLNGHNGIDYIDGIVGVGAPILAAADGVAFAVSDSKACFLTGTVGKGVRIDHTDGTKTIYWHIQ